MNKISTIFFFVMLTLINQTAAGSNELDFSVYDAFGRYDIINSKECFVKDVWCKDGALHGYSIEFFFNTFTGGRAPEIDLWILSSDQVISKWRIESGPLKDGTGECTVENSIITCKMSSDSSSEKIEINFTKSDLEPPTNSVGGWLLKTGGTINIDYKYEGETRIDGKHSRWYKIVAKKFN